MHRKISFFESPGFNALVDRMLQDKDHPKGPAQGLTDPEFNSICESLYTHFPPGHEKGPVRVKPERNGFPQWSIEYKGLFFILTIGQGAHYGVTTTRPLLREAGEEKKTRKRGRSRHP